MSSETWHPVLDERTGVQYLNSSDWQLQASYRRLQASTVCIAFFAIDLPPCQSMFSDGRLGCKDRAYAY